MRGLAAIAFLALVSCTAPRRLDVFGTVPPFQLVDQAGRAFDSHQLTGRVWVADFMYTTCPGPCPMMSSRMHQVAVKTAGTPDVTMVSFTVDPEHDSPAVLAAYAKHFPAAPGRWWFLTGDQGKLNDLGMNAFHLNGVDGTLNHSTRFVLVDGRMRIRGYYATFEEGAIPRLLEDIRHLERNPS